MRIIPTAKSDWLEAVLPHLQAGGVAALPTETVYGLAASLDSEAGVKAIYRMKGRSPEKGLPLQAAGLKEAVAWGFGFSPGALALARSLWPGALTLILPRPAGCPAWFAPGSSTLALRVPDHPVPLRLVKALHSPLAVTSANPSGGADCLTAAEVDRAFGEERDLLILDGGAAPGGVPSTVVDATGREPHILRAGPLSPSKILEAWHG